ncbi:hypothetical protein APR41_11985 [Salegentibacter salinarum]|uniref:Sulfotransferase n=2 Tax=Salegentibacter salinarum TaxID=447422 RepID=A0A2N0U2K9_9FLAO|nr:hypothetical protein APR41_11985 [Salegentibacter salinarum]SKB76262.1 Sulfotransferase family protein [Salegentibacter salinarum]
MKIKDAIIILGPGKSGTTLLNDILALHQDLFWVSTYLNKYPNHPWLSLLNNFQTIGVIEKFTRSRQKFPRPAESFPFWAHYIRNFRFNPKNFNEQDILNAQDAVKKINRYQIGERFITKLTGPSRWRFLEEIFDNPYIIWLDRDPKAVIASFYSYKWKYKNQPEIFKKKEKAELIKEYVTYYNNLQIDKVNLRRFRYCEVYYEDLVDNPAVFLAKLCNFLELEYSKSFKQKVNTWGILKKTNSKYQKIFTPQEISLIENLLSK